jgi:hypothetical protein
VDLVRADRQIDAPNDLRSVVEGDVEVLDLEQRQLSIGSFPGSSDGIVFTMIAG